MRAAARKTMNVPLGNNPDTFDTDLVPTKVLDPKTNLAAKYALNGPDGFQLRPRFKQSDYIKSKIKKMRAAKKPRLDGPYSYLESEFLASISQ